VQANRELNHAFPYYCIIALFSSGGPSSDSFVQRRKKKKEHFGSKHYAPNGVAAPKF
jgi:hypothetical protein